jgi:hypothetical protein
VSLPVIILAAPDAPAAPRTVTRPDDFSERLIARPAAAGPGGER